MKTIYTFLKHLGADVRDYNSHLGNHIEAELYRRGINLNYDLPLDRISENEFFKIGCIYFFYKVDSSKTWFGDEILEYMLSEKEKCLKME